MIRSSDRRRQSASRHTLVLRGLVAQEFINRVQMSLIRPGGVPYVSLTCESNQ